MSETPDALRGLIEQASQAGPGPERLARVRARLQAQIGPLDAPPTSPPALGPTASGLKAVGTLAVVVVIGIALWLGTRSPVPEPTVAPAPIAPVLTTPRTAPSPSEAPVAPALREDEPASAGEPAVSPAIAPLAPRAARPSTVETIDPPPVSDAASSLREEIALLDRALRASEAGDPTRARQALDEHRARFPSGTLSLERDRMLAELAPEP